MVEGDRGGMTYAGIARNFWPDWEGWRYIDSGYKGTAKELVTPFYQNNFWKKMKCDDVIFQNVAESIFDFSVNSGIRVTSRIIQIASGVTADGFVGSKTIYAVNSMNEDIFLARFALAKIARYAQICNKNKSQRKFLLGWINRSLKGV